MSALEWLAQLFEGSEPLTIRTARGFVYVVPLAPTIWVAHDLGIQWIDRNNTSHLVPWSAIEELTQQ